MNSRMEWKIKQSRLMNCEMEQKIEQLIRLVDFAKLIILSVQSFNWENLPFKERNCAS